MKCAALILAAGASRRMGRPKALLAFEGETFLDRLIGIFGRHCHETIVVLGHDADAIRAGMKRQAVFASNDEPERGQLSSMQCGLAMLSGSADAFLFTPVDYPAIRETTVPVLIEALKNDPQTLLAVPRYQGRRGHPVACRASLAAEFLALPAEAQAREVIHRHADQTLYIDVEDAGTVTDVDDPAAYQRLLQAVPAL
ncbi:MAG TPA: nucleotidyltransferase family protein [Bryobacteraceae bacterium]|nr:nucleotidyltransferase family protein [Bryobacteraceae bacterium]